MQTSQCAFFTHQESRVEFKGTGELQKQLVDAVEELEKDWASLVRIVGTFPMTTPVCELVAKLHPFSLHHDRKSLQNFPLATPSKDNQKLT